MQGSESLFSMRVTVLSFAEIVSKPIFLEASLIPNKETPSRDMKAFFLKYSKPYFFPYALATILIQAGPQSIWSFWGLKFIIIKF